jgi:hypothetical protein
MAAAPPPAGAETPILHLHGVMETDRQDKGLGEALAGTSYEYAVVTFSGLISGPSLKVDSW